MPQVNDTTLPDYVDLIGAIVSNIEPRHFKVIITSNCGEGIFGVLDRRSIEGPHMRMTDTTLTVIVAYGAGFSTAKVEPFLGQVVDISCKLAVIIDQKNYKRKVRLFSRKISINSPKLVNLQE